MRTEPEFLCTGIMLERLGKAGFSIIVYDSDLLTDEGRAEIDTLLALMNGRPNAIMAVCAAWLNDLYIFIPEDQLARYKNGFPILIRGVAIESRDANPEHRPDDHETVKAAKNALKIETFRLSSRQFGVEIARNTRSRNLTDAAARDRAKRTIATAVWRGKPQPTWKEKFARFKGLIDRGRRLVKAFFGISAPKVLVAVEKANVLARKNERGIVTLDDIEDDNVARARGVAWNEDHARLVYGAMTGWIKGVRAGQPISVADGNALNNARPERMTASMLMKVAIAGDLNPSDIHKNLLIETTRFEAGRLIGQLSRGRTIELEPQVASIVKSALATYATREIEMQADSCDILIADAALVCYDPPYWSATLDRILETGVSERIPGRFQRKYRS
jgi:hypothetical protein